MSFKKNQPKVLFGWAMYDWANSVYSLVITSAIFPIYFEAVTQKAFNGSIVSFWGFKLPNTVLYSYTVSGSFLAIMLLSPFLSAIADYTGKKKLFMQLFAYIGAAGCFSLLFFTGTEVELAMVSFALANIGFTGSIVFYNAYLPEIATPDKFDYLSARGFSLGYIGSVLLLSINLLMIMQPQWFGNISTGLASRLSFAMVGIWWVGFAQITFRQLPNNVHRKPYRPKWLLNGIKELKVVFVQVQKTPAAKSFLPAFFFYSLGVQTIIYLATLFGSKELNLPSESLIITILLLQLLAIAGSYLFALISKKKGNIFSLSVTLIIWMGVCVGAYFVQNAQQFYMLAIAVGLVMGGVQSLSRSTFAKYIPETTADTASWFAFYDVVEKLAVVLGTLTYGVIEQITGSMRLSSLVLVVFFVTGVIILQFTPRARQR